MSAAAYDPFNASVANSILAKAQETVQGKLQELRKGVTTDEITAVVPEDLETDAYVETWTPDNRRTLSSLKLLANTPAEQVEHKFARQKSYGSDHGFGEVGQTSLPPETTPDFEQITSYVKLCAALSSVYKLAAMEKTIRVNGQVGPTAMTKQAVLRTLLWRKNRGVYFADTTTRRGGTAGLLPKGIIQQIREGTDGTVGTASAFGSHIIDAAGGALTRATLRAKANNLILNYGFPSCAVMSPRVRTDFESSLDAAERITLPAGSKGFVLGQLVGGFETSGGIIGFHDELIFDPIHYQKQYRAAADQGAPGRPTAAAVAQAVSGANVSSWDAASAGDWVYIITEIKDGRESLGRILAAVTVAAGQEVALTLTPSDPYSDAFRIYRILDGGTTTDAYSIFEVANDNDGSAVTAYDLNDDRPGTHIAVFMDVASNYQDDVAQAITGNLQSVPAGDQMARYFRQSDSAQNNVSVAHLGGAGFHSMELAPVLMTDSRPLLFSAYTPQVRGPKKCFVVKNITPSTGT